MKRQRKEPVNKPYVRYYCDRVRPPPQADYTDTKDGAFANSRSGFVYSLSQASV